MANPNNPNDGAPPRDIHVGPEKKAKWVPWLLLALGLLALLFGLRSCNDKDEAARTTVVTTPAEPAPAAAPVAETAAETAEIPAGTSGVGSYLAGTEALPRTFVFEKLNFDTAKSDIRAEDRDELSALAASLKQYPNSRIRIVGYADARGGAGSNDTLGKDRAESVKAALAAQGIDAGRIDTASSGEVDPADTNATATGQAENRRAEVIVLQR